jgi:hypothetical protein
MPNIKTLLLLAIVFVSKICYSQEINEDPKTKISLILENYFDLEREAIHLHTNKNFFMTNESIWYQGYIINRKTNKPYFTTNVFVVLYDEKGNQVSEKLIYACNGVFSGKIPLNSKLHSGNYYIQSYTNWMNNFSENESTITKINVINPEEGIKDYHKLNPESLEVFINPEGGTYVADVYNNMGISVKDCQGNAPENLEVLQENGKAETIKTIKLNKFGFGKFNILPTDEPMKIIFYYNHKKYEKVLPIPEKIGFTIETNNITLDGKVIVKISTNSQTAKLFSTKKLFLLAHQDQKYNLYDLQFNTTLEQTLTLNSSDLFEGINTLRIIDSDLKQQAYRLLYIFPKIEHIDTILKNNRKDDKLSFVGYSTFKNSNLSISILPEDSKCWDENNSIFNGLTINPYISSPIENSNYYFSATNRTKLYELDLVLLNQKALKYTWETMKTVKPTTKYSFDIGLDLKGSIKATVQNKTFHKVKLVSYKDMLMLSSDVTEKGGYHFEHILLADSTYVAMSLQKLPNFEVVDNIFTPQVLNRKKPFYKPFQPFISEGCPEVVSEAFNSDFDFPKLASKAIQLKEVKIQNDKKKLAYENKLGNSNLRGYKIDETLSRQSLLNFIEQNGFNVVRDVGNATIYSRGKTSFNAAQPTPLIMIDERTVNDQYELSLMSMDEIDEIYLSPYAIVPSINNFLGIIKIYRKKIPANTTVNLKKNPNSFYIKDGFTRITPFKNVDYQNTQSQGFDNYGVIEWCPRKTTDEEGQFIFEVTNYNKAKGKIIIQGITNDGQLFQEEKIIDLQ